MMKMITMQDECEVWRVLKYLLVHLIFVDGYKYHKYHNDEEDLYAGIRMSVNCGGP